jgi:L-lactate dehydrogenase complex protein LldG
MVQKTPKKQLIPMSSEKDTILNSIRSALKPLPDKTSYPEWDDRMTVSRRLDPAVPLVDQFASHMEAASGRVIHRRQQLVELLLEADATFGYCDPDLVHLLSQTDAIHVETQLDRSQIDRYQFGITRASGAIAETGTLIFKDHETSDRLAALAPWIHIALIDEKDIVPSLPAAIDRFGDDPSIIFATGPSKTADVEGILIEGVHGPGVQVAWIFGLIH